mmetsp:Transcript_17779/g.62711  ORF Transcript_17779/g.62711 Transcript_17779/m.62711 type:complete len:287 (-) Transcript_17779:1010-1870(-)
MPTSDGTSPSSHSPSRRPIAKAVSSASPVIIVMRTPLPRSTATLSSTPLRGGSMMPTRPRKVRPRRSASAPPPPPPRLCVGSASTGPDAMAMTRRPSPARRAFMSRMRRTCAGVRRSTPPSAVVTAAVLRSRITPTSPFAKNIWPGRGWPFSACARGVASLSSTALSTPLLSLGAGASSSTVASGSTMGEMWREPVGSARTAIHLCSDEKGRSKVCRHEARTRSAGRPSLSAPTRMAASVAWPSAWPSCTSAWLHTTPASNMRARSGRLATVAASPSAVTIRPASP